MDSEKTSEAAIIVKGTSGPSVCAIPQDKKKLSERGNQKGPKLPRAMAVLPVEGGPANNMARPAILPSWTILRIMPAAFLAFA